MKFKSITYNRAAEPKSHEQSFYKLIYYRQHTTSLINLTAAAAAAKEEIYINI